MIRQIAHIISNHTDLLIIFSAFTLAPFMFFTIDSLKHPERYDHK